MQISAISNPNFNGRRDRVDELISLDDNAVRRVAYLKTLSHSNEKKHRRVTNGLIAAAPVAAGLAAAVFTKSPTKIFSKEVSGLAAKAANALKVGGYWAAGLGAVSLVGSAKNQISKVSPDVRKFDREHPFLSLGTLLAASFGSLMLVDKAVAKLGSLNAPMSFRNATGKVAKFLNENKKVAVLKKGINTLLSKTPVALKSVSVTALRWAPAALLLGALLHSASHNSAVNKDMAKNYSEIKEKQLRLSKARQKELAMENDFLKTEARNREDLALVRDPLRGLSEEVLEKVAELQEA